MKLLNYLDVRPTKPVVNEDIIQLVSCPSNGSVCTQNLAEINRLLSTAQQSRFSKEYGRSIEKMKEALRVADEIKPDRCSNCASLFKQTILNSMDNMKEELEDLSKGWFKQARYKASLSQVEVVVEQVKANYAQMA